MNLGDVRRLAVTATILAGLMLGFLLWLALEYLGVTTSRITMRALDLWSLSTWLWIAVSLFFVILVMVVGFLFFLREAPKGYARGIMRQVQCQRCKAVFAIHDTGHRPITHICPNCKGLGVYDGTAPPVGVAPRPEPAKKIISLGLACESCDFHFDVTDTGARPLRVKCPSCQAKGQVL